MISTVTFGYRWEGLRLHQWAFEHTNLKAIVLPYNRQDEVIKKWVDYNSVPLIIQSQEQWLEESIKVLKPDLIICHCYTLKIPELILKMPRLGCINIHPGDLPKYKGKTPIEDAIEKGEKELWVTTHFMDSSFDGGEVISRAPRLTDTNINRMRMKLTTTGLNLLEEYADAYI